MRSDPPAFPPCHRSRCFSGHPEVSCATFEAHLPGLSGLDGPERCPAELVVALAEHESRCTLCARQLKAYAATIRLIRALPRHVGRGLRQRLEHGFL